MCFSFFSFFFFFFFFFGGGRGGVQQYSNTFFGCLAVKKRLILGFCGYFRYFWACSKFLAIIWFPRQSDPIFFFFFWGGGFKIDPGPSLCISKISEYPRPGTRSKHADGGPFCCLNLHMLALIKPYIFNL